MTTEWAIETEAVSKHYGETKALDGVDLRVPKGVVHGLLGPNGAGKTTMVRLLATLLKPTSGRARVLGHDVVEEAAAVREVVSLTGQYASVDEELTGIENMVLIGRLLGHSWADARDRGRRLLRIFDLAEAADRLVRTYSGGMRRRIDIAASLIATPDLLFLDEPTTGLDPRSRNQVWDMVRQIAAAGTTVLLTTQYLEEADRLADRLSVIDHGRIIAEGTSQELKASVGANAVRIRLVHRSEVEAAETALADLAADELKATVETAEITFSVGAAADARRVLSALEDAEIEVAEFSLGTPSLDDVFFALTGRAADDAPDAEEVAA